MCQTLLTEILLNLLTEGKGKKECSHVSALVSQVLSYSGNPDAQMRSQSLMTSDKLFLCWCGQSVNCPAS